MICRCDGPPAAACERSTPVVRRCSLAFIAHFRARACGLGHSLVLDSREIALKFQCIGDSVGGEGVRHIRVRPCSRSFSDVSTKPRFYWSFLTGSSFHIHQRSAQSGAPAREVRAFRRPIAEGRAKPVHGHIVETHAPQHFRQRHIGQRLAGLAAGEHVVGSPHLVLLAQDRERTRRQQHAVFPRGETIGAVWDEVNTSDTVWTGPADCMKASSACGGQNRELAAPTASRTFRPW
jgi:hypothetical protein